ncbi:RHG27 protein, partial [Rhinoptilus africanus]|nr:RHG27 protein [Rhinoptilus africanus]
ADERLDLDDGRWEDIHVVTGALKLFFRELPEPLLPFGHFHKFIAAITRRREGGERPGGGEGPADPLPPPRRVIEHKEENRMSAQSIAIVFGPTLLRPASEEGNMAMHTVFQTQVVEHILSHYGYIF